MKLAASLHVVQAMFVDTYGKGWISANLAFPKESWKRMTVNNSLVNVSRENEDLFLIEVSW